MTSRVAAKGLQDQCKLQPFEPLTEDNTLLEAIQQLAGVSAKETWAAPQTGSPPLRPLVSQPPRPDSRHGRAACSGLGSKVRRVPVVSADGLQLKNILSQSKVVQVLAGLNLPAVAEKTLEESGLADPLPVLSVRGEDPIGKAFEIIKDKVRGPGHARTP